MLVISLNKTMIRPRDNDIKMSVALLDKRLLPENLATPGFKRHTTRVL